MKPEVISCFKTSDGRRVDTLAEWMHAEVFCVLRDWKDGSAETLASDAYDALVDTVIAERAVLIGILSQTERGRPRGAKDAKPRKKAQSPADNGSHEPA